MCVSLCYMERRARALDTDPLGAASCGRPPPEGVARLWIRDPMGRSLFFGEYARIFVLRSCLRVSCEEWYVWHYALAPELRLASVVAVLAECRLRSATTCSVVS